MSDYLSIVSLILFLSSIYVLARANQWSRKACVALLFGAFILPILVLSFSYVWPIPTFFRSSIENIAQLAAIIVLFALSKAVANRVNNR